MPIGPDATGPRSRTVGRFAATIRRRRRPLSCPPHAGPGHRRSGLHRLPPRRRPGGAGRRSRRPRRPLDRPAGEPHRPHRRAAPSWSRRTSPTRPTVPELARATAPELDLPPRRTDRRAACPSPTRSSTWTVNVGGTLNLLEAARRAGARRFVLASTGGAIYGEGAAATFRSTRPPSAAPTRHTGRASTRRRATRRCMGGSTGYATRAAARQRVRTATGPARRGRCRRDLLWRPAHRRAPRGCSATAHQTRDYIYVGDVVEAFLAAAASRRGRHLQRRHRGRDQRPRARRADRRRLRASVRARDGAPAPRRGPADRDRQRAGRGRSRLDRPRTALVDGLRATGRVLRGR